MSSRQRAIVENEADITRLSAIVSYNRSLLETYSLRRDKIQAEVDKHQKRLDDLDADVAAAPSVIEETLKRIAASRKTLTLLKTTGAAIRNKPNLTPEEKKLLRLKKTLAELKALTDELGLDFDGE